ncbi:MAG: NAD-dependent epimerase/dehydratase family protein [Bacteroidota bacterium]
MHTENFLVIGSEGQLGTEITASLRLRHGVDQVIAADLGPANPELHEAGPYVSLNVTDAKTLGEILDKYKISQVYHLAALLSVTGEKNPQLAWHVNMDGLLNVLEACRVRPAVSKVFFPSSIAVFGPHTPGIATPQFTAADPATIYGITKLAGEHLCEWYFRKYGLDVRSLRYPGIVSYKAMPGGGTTDYAIDIYRHALTEGKYTCYLGPDSRMPMMYMPDTLKATFDLMDADASKLSIRSAYNIAGFSFTPAEIAASIQANMPGFKIGYAPDFRQQIADSWPDSIDDSLARADWGWKPDYNLDAMTVDMLANLAELLPLKA